MNEDKDSDPFDDPVWKAYAKQAREKLAPMIEDSAITVSVYSGAEVDPKMAIETGYMVLLDKPIIAVVTPGCKVPGKLALVADEIVEMALDDPTFPKRLQAAMARVMAKQGNNEEKKQ